MNENTQINQTKSFFIENKFIVGIIVLIIAVLAVLALKGSTKIDPKELAEGCVSEEGFSETTGRPCNESDPEPCLEGEVFDRNTGEPCVAGEDQTTTPETGASN